MVTEVVLPPRYEPLGALGKGGGGEVWAVRDRYTGRRCALKMLSPGASEAELAALVREATMLSGLEGLGLPAVHAFGTLPGSSRRYLVRDLVEGVSLQAMIDERADPRRCLRALVSVAEQLTVVHRAGLLHGDVKPANIIVDPEGRGTLVDLGLAAPWRERGSRAEGLTPRYAAPELLQGAALTVRAEVYALGVTLGEVLEGPGRSLDLATRQALEPIARRATSRQPLERQPSVDEVGSALRAALGLAPSSLDEASAHAWPIRGIDVTSSRLLQRSLALAPGQTLCIAGPSGSGRSVLLRRLAWSLGVEGHVCVRLDAPLAAADDAALAELGALQGAEPGYVLVDDAARLSPEVMERVASARRAGARLVVVGGGALAEGAEVFDVPALEPHLAAELVRRALPSLPEPLVQRMLELAQGRPGQLERLVRQVASAAIVDVEELEEQLGGAASWRSSDLPAAPLERAIALLDRGRYAEAAIALDAADGTEPLGEAVARARLALGLGDARAARSALEATREHARAEEGSELADAWQVYLARAALGLGDYAQAVAGLAGFAEREDRLGVEAQAYAGMAHAYLGEDAAGLAILRRAVERAGRAGSARVEALALACLGLVLQRQDAVDEARLVYQRALAAAERASDAGALANLHLNLAGLLKIQGDLAGALAGYEAALDMGRRSGRLASVRQARLNLANLDLYLGRLDRARGGIEALELDRAELGAVAAAQLLGLRAELLDRSGEDAAAETAFRACAEAYEALGLGVDAAAALLEGVLVGARRSGAEATALEPLIARAVELLGGANAHQALLALARARVAWLAGDEALARRQIDEALGAALAAEQRDWQWRALEIRAEVEDEGGQPTRARRDREDALSVLEDLAARLPRDLREVFWNAPRRAALRERVGASLPFSATEHVPFASAGGAQSRSAVSSAGISALTRTPLERRLARILEINAELLGELDVSRLSGRVIEHAVAMLEAERGCVVLLEESGRLVVHASRASPGDGAEAELSRSIARRVVETRQPVLCLDVAADPDLAEHSSVHRLGLRSVACVPIVSRSAGALGALYVETRSRPGAAFERELPTLRAFADQVAMALETARLVDDNQRRAAALEESNRRLASAEERLRELLEERTASLRKAREKLRDARQTLDGRFGYQGIVGTSPAIRRVYALIERVKTTDLPILITGESGTGKELAARAIHRGSERAKRPLLAVNCGAIPPELLASELFGHVRGAFTGAERERKGIFREAAGGSVFLDEIGEMSQQMQTGLLRVLQERKVRPVGGSSEEDVDARVILATHRNLEQMVREGSFREDLYYRIHVVEVALPPLRARLDDIPILVDHFLGLFATRYQRERGTLTRDALRRLMAYEWPGNVRQLEHVLLNAWVLADHAELDADDLDLPDGRDVLGRAGQPAHTPSSRPPQTPRVDDERTEPAHTPSGSSDSTLESAEAGQGRRVGKRRPASASRSTRGGAEAAPSGPAEKQRILDALRACNWNRLRAASMVGIPRRTFYRRLRDYGIQ